MSLLPFRTRPRYLDKTWGSGVRLQRVLGLPAPPGTGEVWLVSDVEGAPSEVADGPWAGRSLRELVQAEPRALLGQLAGDRFPLLVKLLEIGEPLSVQVHPDGPTAALLGDGALGKSEAWFVLDVGPAGRVWLGLERPPAPSQLAELSRSGALAERLHAFAPEEGEAVEILPGTFHTARDLLLLEVQETSDVTYRVYDWGRDRPLHLDQAAACLERLPRPVPPRTPAFRGGRQELAPRSPFSFEAVELGAAGPVSLPTSGVGVVVALGDGVQVQALKASQAGSLRLGRGEAAVVPASCGGCRLLGPAASRAAWATPR